MYISLVCSFISLLHISFVAVVVVAVTVTCVESGSKALEYLGLPANIENSSSSSPTQQRVSNFHLYFPQTKLLLSFIFFKQLILVCHFSHLSGLSSGESHDSCQMGVPKLPESLLKIAIHGCF